MSSNGFVAGFIVPGLPHPLLAPDQAEAWKRLRVAFDKAREEIAALKPDLLMIYSTQWLSVIGHQIQADPEPRWNHVDPEWHALGTIPYVFRIDSAFAKAYEMTARARGLHTRTVAYRAFPIDTGSVVALKLLNPDNAIPACIVSSNMYSDRAETLVLGKAAADAVQKTAKRAVAVAVTGLSYRMFTKPIAPSEDRIYAQKDDEWNRKLLEILGEGRLEDASQLAREFSLQANGDQKMKALWWLAAAIGQHNRYEGKVFDYQPIWGTGAAVVGMRPSEKAEMRREFDEEDVEVFRGNDRVLGAAPSAGGDTSTFPSPDDEIRTTRAPKPVGPYPHARRVGNLIYVSGIGPRDPKTNSIPGGPVRDATGKALNYDVEAQTRAVIENIRVILEDAGAALDRIVDVQVFLIDMDRDFQTFNRVYAEYFQQIQPTRTTVAVSALPTPIAVELKVIARAD